MGARTGRRTEGHGSRWRRHRRLLALGHRKGSGPYLHLLAIPDGRRAGPHLLPARRVRRHQSLLRRRARGRSLDARGADDGDAGPITMNVRALAAVAVVFLVPASARAADAPPWLQQAARLAPAAVEQRAHAVVLLDDVEVIVSDDGQSTTTRRRYAVKVIDRDGAPAAALREVYTTDTGRVRVMRGWVVSDGRTQELGKAHIAD